MDLVTLVFGIGVGLSAATFLRAIGAVTLRSERRMPADPGDPFGWDPVRPDGEPRPRNDPSDRPSEVSDLIERPATEVARSAPDVPDELPHPPDAAERAEVPVPTGQANPSVVRFARDWILSLQGGGTGTLGDLADRDTGAGVSPRPADPSSASIERVAARLAAVGIVERIRDARGASGYRLTPAGSALAVELARSAGGRGTRGAA